MNSPLTSTRDYAIDHVRFILIFAVVFAHLLEVCAPFPGCFLIYKLIYTFHMPAFIFLFGYNIRYSSRKIIYRWCLPYMAFQCAYLFFAKHILKSGVEFQFSTPYWLLWYMLACIYYQLLLPLFDTDHKGRQVIAVLSTFVISLLVGFVQTVGYYMSLSRFFVFQPWFLLGYYCKKHNLLERLSCKPKIRSFILLGSAAVMAMLVPSVCTMPNRILYGSYFYAGCNGTVWMRVTSSVMAFAAILFLCVGMKPYLRRKLPLITTIGQHTWPIFLLHGFLIKAIPVYFPELVSTPWRVLLLACAILVLAGNPFCTKAVYYASFSWLEKYDTRK